MRYRVGVPCLTVAISSVGVFCGCDRKSGTPTPPVVTPSAAVQQLIVHRPTTQELLDTPFASMSLEDAGVPATIMVPKGWELKRIGDSDRRTLEGYAPSGLMVIAFAPVQGGDAEKKQTLIDMTKAEMAASPVAAGIPVVRQSGDAVVLEKVELLTENPTPGQAAATQPMTLPATQPAGPDSRVQWTVTLCSPYRGRFFMHQLRLFNLSRAQFDADHEFLQKIMGSMAYVPPAPETK